MTARILLFATKAERELRAQMQRYVEFMRNAREWNLRVAERLESPSKSPSRDGDAPPECHT